MPRRPGNAGFPGRFFTPFFGGQGRNFGESFTKLVELFLKSFMALQGPDELRIATEALFMDYLKTYSEPVFGLEQYVRVGLVSFPNSGFTEDGAFIVWLVENNRLPVHSIQAYINFQNLISQCASHAENI